MTWLLALLAAVLVVGAFVVAWRRSSHGPPPRREAWSDRAVEATGRITLDLADVDADDPAVARLAHDAAARALLADQTLDTVEVRDREGHLLHREARGPLRPEVVLPDQLRGPQPLRHHGPTPVRHDREPLPPLPVGEPEPTVTQAPLADRLDLPPPIRRRVSHPDRPTDVVHAILLAAGLPNHVEGDLIRCGDVAIVIVDPQRDAEAALTHGYLRVQATDARRGIVLRTGYADPRIVRRREAAAPHVRHVGPDGIQRMADAVAVGADPIAFAAGPPTVG